MDARVILILLWLAIGLDSLRLGVMLFHRRMRLREFVRTKVAQYKGTQTERWLRQRDEESVITRAELVRTGVKTTMALAVTIVGLSALVGVTWASSIDMTIRQWVSTICILWLAVGLEWLLRNDLSEDGMLHGDEE